MLPKFDIQKIHDATAEVVYFLGEEDTNAVSNKFNSHIFKLPNGKKAQVQVIVTTEEEDFINKQ